MIRELDLGRERRVQIQRFKCCRCGKSFVLRKKRRRRYSEAFALEVVRRHVEGRESYRVIAREVFERTRRSVSPTSLQKMVESAGERSKSVLEMSKELKPSWDGFLLLDEKMCSVCGKQQWLYLAVDGTGDIVHCRGVGELTATNAMSFLEDLVHELEYPCRGVVTDMDAALCRAVEVVYPEKPHQYCLKHALAALEEVIGYKPLLQRYRWNRALLREQFTRMPGRRGIWVEHTREEFFRHYTDTRALSKTFHQRKALRDTLHAILFASSEGEAVLLLHRLRRSRQWPTELRRKAVAFLERHWRHLVQHHRVHGLPRTTNLVENVNRQLERRFKTIEAFQHVHTALAYVNLLIAYLRQKPYTDCRGKRRGLNGHSRLLAAGVRLTGSWLNNALKTIPNSNR